MVLSCFKSVSPLLYMASTGAVSLKVWSLPEWQLQFAGVWGIGWVFLSPSLQISPTLSIPS